MEEEALPCVTTCVVLPMQKRPWPLWATRARSFIFKIELGIIRGLNIAPRSDLLLCFVKNLIMTVLYRWSVSICFHYKGSRPILK